MRKISSIVFLALTSSASAQSLTAIGFDEAILVSPGASESARIIIDSDELTEYFGYSLSLKAVPRRGAHGTVTIDTETAIDPEQTNLYLAKNLVAAYPAPLDPFFTMILPQGNDGVFINANISVFDLRAPDFVTVTTGINDVLAEIVFDATPDASGVFDLVLGPATALSDPSGFAIPFIYVGATLTVHTPDLNGDGTVSAADLAILLGDWGGGGLSDLDENGVVNATDLALLLGAWD